MKIQKDILSERCQKPTLGLDAFMISLQTENKLTTGSRRLDKLLSSLRTGLVYEVIGSTDTGKTQLCLTTMAECLKAGGRVNYIDTKGDFSLQRLQQILSGRGSSEAGVLQNVILHQADTETELVETVTDLQGDETDMQLLVVDNITSPLLMLTTEDNLKRGMYVGCTLGHIFQKIAASKGAVVMLVSNVKPNTDRMVALGALWEHTANVRVLLEDDIFSGRRASVMRGGVRKKTAAFSINNKGITDS